MKSWYMIPQQQQEITPQLFSQQMGQLKRRVAQVAGETNQMTAETNSDTMNAIMQLVNQLFQQGAAKDRTIQEVQAKLDKCYNAHPELKVAEEAEAKAAAEKQSKKAKKV